MDDFWDTVCGWIQMWYLLFVICSAALFLTTFSFFITIPGTAPYYVNLINFVFLIPTTVGSFFVLRQCRKNE